MGLDESASSMVGRKRNRDQANLSPVTKSKAARFNAHTLKRLQNAAHNDPEIDLTTQLPTDYSNRLVEMRESRKGHLGRLRYGMINDRALNSLC